MSRLQIQTKAMEYDRCLTEQFIGWLNDEGMSSEILRKTTTLEDIEDATSEKVLIWTQRWEVQRAQKIMSDNINRPKSLI